jgi:hypothetical protein
MSHCLHHLENQGLLFGNLMGFNWNLMGFNWNLMGSNGVQWDYNPLNGIYPLVMTNSLRTGKWVI